MKRLLALVLLIFPLVSVVADPPRSWNHDMNPALLSVRNRRLIELGVSSGVGVGNNYFTLEETLVPELIIDLNQIHTDLSGRDLRFASTFDAEGHLVASLFGITAGWYSTVNGVVSGGVPNSVIDLLANGSTFESEPLSSSSPIVGRVFADMGVYGGMRWRDDYHIGMKVGAFAPVFYTDRESSVSFGFETDPVLATTTVSAAVNMKAYTAVDFDTIDQLQPNEAISLLNGRKVDIGIVKADRRKPLYGVNLSGITLKRAVVDNMISFQIEEEVIIDDPLGNYDPEADDPTATVLLFPEDFEFEPEFATGVNQRIAMPLQLGGFYRLRGLPLIDVIGHGQLYFANPVQVSVGAIVEGSFFPLNILSLGVAYDRGLWEATTGLKLNLWLMELGVDLGLTGPTLRSAFGGGGATAKVYFAMGL